ncbi:hypothetical protein B0A48_05033 [Cryoendolithus antarcticus]|uniref:Rhodopsin domain-containing protein n=1 Tax=Cryoendolithus antarcticus TaxID=1507870 RepID=A0A1V8TEE0_9PEZI|nr:hypothetical protein B0A48_05033 [Cryoendolithus antarcticus]
MIIIEVHFGLGRRGTSLSDHERATIAVATWANQYMGVLVLGFSKLSACFLLARMTKTQKHLRVAYTIATVVVMWALQSMLSASFQCKLPHPWLTKPPNTCMNRWAQSLASGIASWIIELLLVAAAVYLVWDLMMPKQIKIAVVIAFSTRLLLVPFGIWRLFYFQQTLSTNPSDSQVKFITMSIIAAHVSVISATIPCLQPFLSSLSTGAPMRPKAWSLPTHRRSAPTAVNSQTSRTTTYDRHSSIKALRLRPPIGQNRVAAEHVSASKEVRPSMPRRNASLSHSQTSQQSSITVTRDFAVTFSDVGGLLQQDNPRGGATSSDDTVKQSSPGVPRQGSRKGSSELRTRESGAAGSACGSRKGCRRSSSKSLV